MSEEKARWLLSGDQQSPAILFGNHRRDADPEEYREIGRAHV